jgi:hypothetical protein
MELDELLAGCKQFVKLHALGHVALVGHLLINPRFLTQKRFSCSSTRVQKSRHMALLSYILALN